MRPDEPFFRLADLEDKALIAGHLGLDLVVALTFDSTLLHLSSDAFELTLLGERLGVGGLVVGPNFRYGHRRHGDVSTLLAASRRLGFDLHVVAPVEDACGQLYSSSGVRALLGEGRVAEAAGRLGHFWFVRGPVAHGDKRGRELGFPTANVILPSSCGLAHGIYAVRCLIDGKRHDGVASFGRRPTFDNGAPRLETYLLDFSGDLYGKPMVVEFIARIRGEERFDSIDSLIARMAIDVQETRRHLATIDADGPVSILL